MFACGTYEYGLKTGDLPEKEMVKIFENALSKIAGEINDSRIPKKWKLIIDQAICFCSCTLIERKTGG